MAVRIVSGGTSERACPESDYLQVRTRLSPEDDTVTLATIQRCIDKGGDVDATGTTWKIRILVADQPMSRDEAMGLATRYAERKNIPLVMTDPS